MVNPTEPWVAKDYDDGLLNGSEEMVVEFARHLSESHNVRVYCSSKVKRYTDVSKDGVVNYYDHSYLSAHAHSGVLIAFKNADALLLEGFSKRYLWTADCEHLTATQRRLCDGLVAISKWHEHELKCTNIGYSKISYIEPGVRKYDNYSYITRIPKQCLYASSPDRGLDYLLEIWPLVLKEHPDATLITTYSGSSRRTNQEMVDLYCQSDVLAYPCTGQERYCITAIKAQMYGCIPCVIPHMALQDTAQFGVKSLKKDYLNSIIDLLSDSERRSSIREKMVKDVNYNTWDDVIDKWRKLIG